MTNAKSQKPIYKITTTAIMIALSTVLSLIKVVDMPLGGSITLLSMLPICLVGIMYGTRFAIAPCILYGAIQMFIGNPFGWGLTPTMLIGCILFDYIVAFGVLCLSGLFRKKSDLGIVLGIVVACLARFASHFVSGYVVFKNLEQFELFGSLFESRPILYSICYNGFYMLPELIITALAAFLIFRSKAVKRYVLGEI